MDGIALDRMLADPILDLPSRASRLGWLLDCADRQSLPLDRFLDEEELLRDLVRVRIRRLEFANAVIRRRQGLGAAAAWMGRPNPALDGQRPSDLLDHEFDDVLDAAWSELHDTRGAPDALDANRDTATSDVNATGVDGSS